MQPGHPPAVHLAWELESAPAYLTYLEDHLPADDCQWTTHNSWYYCTSHWLEQTKVLRISRYHNHGNVHINQDLELFSFPPATRMHPTQLWYTLTSISMRLKILLVSLKFIVRGICVLPDLFSSGMLYRVYIISSTSCYLRLQIEFHKQQYIKYRGNF